MSPQPRAPLAARITKSTHHETFLLTECFATGMLLAFVDLDAVRHRPVGLVGAAMDRAVTHHVGPSDADGFSSSRMPSRALDGFQQVQSGERRSG